MADSGAPPRKRGRPKLKVWARGEAATRIKDFIVSKIRTPSPPSASAGPTTAADPSSTLSNDLKRLLKIAGKARAQSMADSDACVPEAGEASLFLASKREVDKDGGKWELRAEELTEDLPDWFEKEVRKWSKLNLRDLNFFFQPNDYDPYGTVSWGQATGKPDFVGHPGLDPLDVRARMSIIRWDKTKIGSVGMAEAAAQKRVVFRSYFICAGAHNRVPSDYVSPPASPTPSEMAGGSPNAPIQEERVLTAAEKRKQQNKERRTKCHESSPVKLCVSTFQANPCCSTTHSSH